MNKDFARGMIVSMALKSLPVRKKAPIAYLYNGVRLPALPEWDRERYPYVLISDRYSLEPTVIMTSMPFSEPHEYILGEYVTAPECLYTRYVLDNGKWIVLDEPTTVTSPSEKYDDLVWSNYDIPGLDGSVYLAASTPIPIYNEPVNYLYNGVKLPKLPEWDKTVYPCAVIEYADVDQAVRGGRLARLICASEPIIHKMGIVGGYNLTGDVLYFGFVNDEFLWRFSFSLDEPYPPINEWAQIGENHFDESTFVATQISAATLIWANHDVIDANYGWVFVSASEPIPVYE